MRKHKRRLFSSFSAFKPLRHQKSVRNGRKSTKFYLFFLKQYALQLTFVKKKILIYISFTQIEAFNGDIKWFLSTLSSHCKNDNTSNETTVKLLNQAVDSIQDFLDNAKIVETKRSTWPSMDDEEDVFLVQRTFICCVCRVSGIFCVFILYKRIDYNCVLL